PNYEQIYVKIILKIEGIGVIILQSYYKHEFLFQFLEKSIPYASQAAFKMEQLFFTDSASAIVKARLFAEEVLKEVFKIEKIDTTYLTTFYDKVLYLSNNEYVVREIQHAFDTIRRSGNKAAHDGTYEDIMAAFQLHKEMYKIAVWFYEIYTSEQEIIPPYRHPKPNASPGIEDIKDIIKNALE